MKTKCAVRGMIQPGAMCGSVIVGGEFCGHGGPCEHQRKGGTIADVVEILKGKDQAQEVQFLVVSNDGQIIAMDLRDELVDLSKLFKAFKKPKK